jgi:lipoyl(octanoyl) transferase
VSEPLEVRRLGFVEYEDGLRLMEVYRGARAEGRVADTIFLLEHFPVLTLGRKGRRADILVDLAELERRGIQVFETDRGGEGTYHGPGQIVGYPIVALSPDRRDVRRYVRDLEETMLRAALDAGVRAGRVAGLNGIWLAPDADPPNPGPARKLGALGVHLARWVTSHGFALNVNTDLAAFDLIVACGIRDRGVTSLAAELGRSVSLVAVEASLERHLAELLDREPVARPIEHATVQVQVARPGRNGVELLALHRLAERGGFWQPVTGRVESGESFAGAAQRELEEETGLTVAVESLEYRHAFLWPGASRIPGPGGMEVAEESAFVVEAPAGFRPTLSAREHDVSEWVSPAEAAARFPFAGLRRGAGLATKWVTNRAARGVESRAGA